MAPKQMTRIAWTVWAAVDMAWAPAHAAEYPARPVRMVVPIGPGSSMDITALAEAGVPGYEVDVWYGLFAPKGTPSAMVARISADARRVLLEPANRDRFASLGVDPVGSSPDELKELLARDTAKWSKVVKAAGIVAQ